MYLLLVVYMFVYMNLFYECIFCVYHDKITDTFFVKKTCIHIFAFVSLKCVFVNHLTLIRDLILTLPTIVCN